VTGIGTRIPLVDLRAAYQAIAPEIEAAIRRVVERGEFILGEEARSFEREWAEWCGVAHAVAVSNGTDALRLSLLALGVGQGSEVVTVAHTFIATAEAIASVGARPVFVDVDPRTHTMDPACLAAALSPRTAAVIPVHLYGRPADLDAILPIASRHGVPLVEDAAQAHGARVGGRRVGGVGRLGCFSFFPSKNLGAYGDAGAVVTDDGDLAERIRRLRDHGRTSKYVHVEAGLSCRMDALQAAVLRTKLPHLDRWNAARAALVRRYHARLDEAPPIEYAGRGCGGDSVNHLMVVEIDGRDEVRECLGAAGVATGVHYPVPLHLQPAFAHLGYREGDLPATERACRRVLSLPLYPEMPPGDVDVVVMHLRRAMAAER
jgi:dTDP-4-amino-4,6-dideoxygalactose transaminase